MPAMYNSSLIQKEKTERVLSELLTGNSDIKAITTHVKSTPVKKEDRNILDIYYRRDAIRINISPQSKQYSIYQQLLEEGIAYQKDTANPNSTNGVFAFFVSENNVRKALTRLLELKA